MKPRTLASCTPLLLLALLGLSQLSGCGGVKVPKEVIVYTALDEEFSKPIFAAFTRQTGIVVKAKFDTESTKTVGLAGAILAERERPRADVFWNNELLHTLRLKKAGLLWQQPLAADKDYPAEYRGVDNDWRGFAARARVLIVNTNRIKEARWPKSIEDLTDPQWYDQAGVAKPLFGTTATHAACLFQVWGDERAKKFFTGVKKNCRIVSGNKQVAKMVARGQLAFGLTDTDDAMIEKEAGQPVEILYPDQPKGEEAESLGTLFIPNTVAMIKDSPNPKAAHALSEFLLTSLVECRLVIGPSAQIPLNYQSKKDNSCRCRVKTPDEVTPMQVDWNSAADGWDESAKWLGETFGAAL
ncbi:putative binding protein component of ABC iron transporter precursor [Planctomycetes bacterium MalM25]|nr:putative binding protein component of ABC iron transporter precursor [Planctomycetes bacterium MalM25]